MLSRQSFDDVIVGAGAAGCVIAGRLSEAASRSVLLLEAGPDPRPTLPEIFLNGWKITREFDWGYTSEPDDRGVTEKLRRGKVLGGTAWYTRYALRGAAAGYDEWSALGNLGWGFSEMLPYLKRLENDLEFGREQWHGDGGPIPITRYPGLEASDIGARDAASLRGSRLTTCRRSQPTRRGRCRPHADELASGRSGYDSAGVPASRRLASKPHRAT